MPTPQRSVVVPLLMVDICLDSARASVVASRIRPVTTILSALLLATSLVAGPSTASDGVLEINQTCAAGPGCFSGDTAGYPITINGSAGRSYRLTSDLVVPNENTDGIQVNTSDVGIDLNNFSIIRSGCVGATTNCTALAGTGSGVEFQSSTNRGNSVRNGSITGMGNMGVYLGEQSEVINLRVRWNRIAGMDLGIISTISGVVAFQNGGVGISGSLGSAISSSTAYQNGTDGIVSNSGSTVSDSTAYDNGDDGFDVSIGSTIRGNAAYSNGGNGIEATTACLVSDNSTYSNGLDGIFAGSGSIVSNNLAQSNGGDGIQAGLGSTVQRNTTRSNVGYGINLSADASYRENTVTSNTLGTTNGGVNMGSNSCNGVTSCP